MPLNLEKLQSFPVTETVHRYEDKDTILYALAIGLGTNPVDERQLKFVYERGLHAFPTMAVTLGASFPWLRDPETGINVKKMLHGESSLTLLGALPASGAVVGRVSIEGVVDRGIEKGAALYFRHDVHNEGDGTHVATVRGCFVFRDGGGGGSTQFSAPVPNPIPSRQPDSTVESATLPQSALIYRLTGDRNPLHADPGIARAAGFDMPILHGSCSYGVVGHALLAHLCDYAPARLRKLDLRFSAPLYPGETLMTEIWKETDQVYAFRSKSLQRGTVVLNNGRVEIR